jgi:uncharacterized small protein (TIGR04563 family)
VSPRNDKPQVKRVIYVPAGMLAEIRAEAARLDRTFAWLVQRAWMIARRELREMKSDGYSAGNDQ